MKLNKLLFLTVLFSALGSQVGLSGYPNGRIEIKNEGAYVIKRIKCWDSGGRRTHSSGRLLSPNKRHCDDSSYLKIEGIVFKQGKFEKRFYRLSEGCVAPTQKLCIKAKGTTISTRFESYCRSTERSCF